MPIGSPQWMYNSGSEFTLDQSLRFDHPSAHSLSKTFASAGNRKTWSFSAWAKRGYLSSQDNHRQVIFSCVSAANDTGFLEIGWNSDDTFYITTQTAITATSAKFRDTSSWYHILVACDTTQSTATNRFKVYINGVDQAVGNLTSVSEDADTAINQAELHSIGKGYTDRELEGYLAEVHFINGTALTPSSFGETGDYGEWKPIEYSGSYGTNGFYLDFADSGALGDDESGNTNDFTANNLAAADQVLDSPSNNFPTLNALNYVGALSEGNLAYTAPTSDSRTSASTMASSSGKWYAEVLIGSTGTNWVVGVASAKLNALLSADKLHNYTGGNASYLHNGNKSLNGTQTSYGATYTTGDIIGIALDVGSGTVTFYKNNASQGSITLPTSNDTAWQFALGSGTGGASHSYNINFGQDSSFAGGKTAQGNQDGNSIGDFYYTPPTNYLALCTSNLPDASIVPSEYFNTVLYTGNATARSITGVGFQPDFVWNKTRSANQNHFLYDAVRGASKDLRINQTGTEGTSDAVTAFGADGFSVGSGNDGNENTETYVNWNWKANGTGSSNTDGSINSTATSASVDAGFSIVTYTGNATEGATVGHGLSKAPEVIMLKKRSGSSGWYMYHSALGATKNIEIQVNSAAATTSNIWNDTEPTADVFSLGNNAAVNGTSATFVAYCFHSVDGYSKFGSYTGNANADGTFVYTGFKPAFVMIKRTDGAKNWSMYDNKRDSINPNTKQLYANKSNVEYDDATYTAMDFVSNGFKWRTDNTGENVGSYIFLAFASVPFKYSNGE